MPRNMSFMHTTTQVYGRTKTETCRLGWSSLKVGDVLNACVKCQGLGKGKKVEVICQIRIVSNKREPLNVLKQENVNREGFPEMTPAQFVAFFCKHMRCQPDQIVSRIRFEYVEATK